MSSVHVYDEVALGTMTMHASDEDADLLKAVIARAELTIYGTMNPGHVADQTALGAVLCMPRIRIQIFEGCHRAGGVYDLRLDEACPCG